jgi:hypothetical protein
VKRVRDSKHEHGVNYTIEHLYIDTTGSVNVIRQRDGTKRVQFLSSGDLPIRHPGALNIAASASYYIHMKVDGSDPTKPPRPTRPTTQHVALPVTVTIYSPDGLVFSGGNVTRDDLNRFRDLRNVSHGTWRYEASGLSNPLFISDEDGSVAPGDSFLSIHSARAIEERTQSLEGDIAA